MRAIHRFGELLLAGALALAPAVALAQQAPAPNDTPQADAVGPKELQNFTLNGTVTRQADQPTPVQAAPKRAPRTEAQAATQSAATRPSAATPAPAPAARRTETASAEPLQQKVEAAPEPEPLRQSSPSSSVTVALPKLSEDAGTSTAAEPASAPTFAPPPQTPGTLAPEHKLAILPWLLAALALGAGGAFLFWRNRGREAFAGGPQMDAFTTPAPPPAPPRPAPAPPPPPKAPPAAPAGIVSTRLRPWLEIGFMPLRCILEDQHLIVEFELELFNSGSAPARSVLVEGSLFNAGSAQDAELGAFFENPVAEGDRISAIPPLKRASLKTRVLLPRERLAAYEIAGRQVFIPLIAFNALYSWGGGAGQTSVGYLLGRDTSGEKVGPFRLDLGPRIFRGIGARLLPTGVRR